MASLIRPIRPRLRQTDRQRRVLALCGDTQVGLWMLRSLAMHGLEVHAVVHSPAGQAAHSRWCASAWLLDSGPDAPDRASQIVALAHELQVGSVMPIAESYHTGLIAVRHQLEPAIHLFSPDAATFDRATDKDAMQALCGELGIPVARGTTLDRLQAGGGDALAYPLVLRTRRQNLPGATAPWKAAYAESPEQLASLAEPVRAIADNIVVQEYHPGAEDHVQVLMHEGEAFAAGEYIGEHHMPLAGGVTVRRVSCRHEPLVADAVRLLQAIGWQGIAGVQFHYDPATDRYIFLEINPRFIGGLPTVILAGFHAPYLLWQSRFEPERMERPRYRLGLRTRILGGDANWTLGMVRGDQLPPGQRRVGKLSALASFAWHAGPWTHDDSFLWRDPRPFLADLRQMVRRLGGEKFDIIGNPQTQETRA